MGRSSSSRKKKSSKSSSLGRTKKRSRIRNRKSESKKKLRHYSSDDDDSRSSISGSRYSSSSEDTKHRIKKSHSRVRTKKHVAIKKKKRKRRSSSGESSDEESPITRKRKGSKRKRDRDSTNKSKSHSKKKRTRVEDSDSYSSDGISRETKRSRFRSMSPLCSDRSEDGECRNEVAVENNSRRLRSVIVSVVAEREKEKEKEKENEKEKEKENENEKEEVIFHDDYPSSRSNDSNDSGNKIEEHESEKADGTIVSGLETSKNGEVLVGPLGNFEEKMNEKVEPDDLEAVLRQRALENLRKFRRVISSDQKAESAEDCTQLPVSTEAQLVKDTNFLSQVEENSTELNIKAVPIKPNIAQTSVSSVRPKLVRPVFARQVTEINATLVSHESRDELKRSKSCLDETASGIVASEEPSLRETVSDKPQESKDGSEFENKTMTVMRGGEMVQVSYKVYIPKKVPALARRNVNG